MLNIEINTYKWSQSVAGSLNETFTTGSDSRHRLKSGPKESVNRELEGDGALQIRTIRASFTQRRNEAREAL